MDIPSGNVFHFAIDTGHRIEIVDLPFSKIWDFQSQMSLPEDVQPPTSGLVQSSPHYLPISYPCNVVISQYLAYIYIYMYVCI